MFKVLSSSQKVRGTDQISFALSDSKSAKEMVASPVVSSPYSLAVSKLVCRCSKLPAVTVNGCRPALRPSMELPIKVNSKRF